jgi:hypothetical protein
MPQVGFEPTISVPERAKTVHALDARGHCDRHVVITDVILSVIVSSNHLVIIFMWLYTLALTFDMEVKCFID